MAAELGSTGIPVEYVVLQVSLEQAVRRATSRAQPGAEAMVRHMHAAFQDLNDYASHALDTTDLALTRRSPSSHAAARWACLH